MCVSCHCLHPRPVYNKYIGQMVAAPCGKCSVCLSERALRWTNRLKLECQRHKYSLFFTLTYSDDYLPKVNPYTVVSGSSTYEASLRESADYIAFCGNDVPCVNMSDFSAFIKRVRARLVYKFPELKHERFLRYFVTSEYGPTTFRPHFHGFLWFDSPDVYKAIKEVVYKSWPSASTYSTSSAFFRRNRFRFVGGQAAAYVANYINSLSFLPSILKERPFRVYHCQSICNPVGSFDVSEQQIKRLAFGVCDKIAVVQPDYSKIVEVSLWPSAESRWFPRFAGFHRFTDGVRQYFYNAFVSAFSGLDCKQYLAAVNLRWFDDSFLISCIRSCVCHEAEDLQRMPALSERVTRSLKRLFYVFRRLCSLSEKYEWFTFALVISYYQRKEYTALCSQLSFYQEVLDEQVPDGNNSLEFLPFFIDPLFAYNQRGLSSLSIDYLVSQFHVTPYSFSYFNKFYRYLDKKFISDRIVSSNVKCRLKKDYLSRHPEYMNFYSNIYKTFI